MKSRIRRVHTMTESEYRQLQIDIASEALADGARQGIAAVLAGMSKHGYGKKRLQDILGWAQDVLTSPAVFNKELTAEEVIDCLLNDYDVDVYKLKFNIKPDYAEKNLENNHSLP